MTTQELIKTLKRISENDEKPFESEIATEATDRLAQLETQLAIVTAERDKAVKKFELFAHHYAHLCCLCKADCINAGKRIGDEDATVITQCSRFQWRGIEKDGEANE